MQLDSTKIKLQLENLEYEKSLYSTQTKITPDLSEQTKFTLFEKPLGLKHIEILPTTNEVLVEFSAKILKDQYLMGINKNTVERVYSEIKPYIKCSFDDILNSIVLRTDITENLMFDSQTDKENALKSLILGKSNTGFKVDDFVSKNSESIIFTGRQVSYKNRQIYYNKEKELFLARNKEIMKYLQKQHNEIAKILRVEQNVSSFDKIRQAIGKNKVNSQLVGNFDKPNINSVKLNEMLLSTHKPLYERHRIIMKYANEIDLFNEFDDFFIALIKYGIIGLYMKCNSSLELLLDFAKQTTTASTFNKNKNKMFGYFTLKEFIIRTVQDYEHRNSNNSADNDYFDTLKIISEMLKVV